MDKEDEKILQYLEEYGRASYTEIPEGIGVSEGTVRNYVENLLEDGVIEKFTVERGSQDARAVIMVQFQTDGEIEELLEEFPEK
jgi:DNA-binding Lrp family transcriptional regulator